MSAGPPAAGPGVPIPPGPRPGLGAAPGWPPAPRRRGPVLAGEVLGVALGLTGLVWMLRLVAGQGGAGATALAVVLALIPLAGVLAAIRWVDRWEPEPRGTLLGALAWGVGVATTVSLVGNELFAASVYLTTGDEAIAEALGAVVGAPLVEESAKGLGVLLIFLVRRRYFDGPVDGIVYASVVAAGFAFTENILYFVQYQEILGEVFLARAVQGPFAHVTFTACTGLALGIAARSATRWAALWLAPVGWTAAVLLHALWNGSAVLLVHESVYWAVQVPLFVLGVVIVVWLRAQERRVIARSLAEYAAAGWFAPYEVTMLTSLAGRRQARRWAAGRGPQAGRAMTDFQAAATELAFARHRARTGRRRLRGHQGEEELLHRLTRARGGYAADPAGSR